MRSFVVLSALAVVGLSLSGCGDDGSEGSSEARPPAGEDRTRDILSTGLELNLTALTGKATITLAGSSSEAASFEIGDLDVASVRDEAGALNFAASGGQLNVGVPRGGDATIVVDYTFKPHTEFDGWMPTHGISFLWPYFCGNLFPCKSDPADGVRFTMSVTGFDSGLTAVVPAAITADAPSYMPAIAVGPFTELDLGTTAKGTKVSVWYLPGGDADAVAGTAHLRDVFEFYEATYGHYSFGTSVGSVSADWGPGDYGGMEHHPFWHVGTGSMYSEEIHAHEAAHGWYGDGVRIECWEDFVLSEGTVTYMAAHALEQLGIDIWHDYECDLRDDCDPANAENTIALPDETCNEIDILHDPLWSSVPYKKGAFYYRAVADAIGVDVLDQALAEFYEAHVGKAARMQELIDFIKTKTDAAGGATIEMLTTDWLRTLDCPVDYTQLCQ